MRKKIGFVPGLIISAVLIGAPPKASGQGLTWAGESLQQMVDAARWTFGLLRVNAALEISDAGYDSDVFYGYVDEAIPDFTLLAGAPVQVMIPASKDVVFDLQDTPEYAFYLETKNERAFNNTFSGRMHIALERFYFQVGGGLSNVRRRFGPEMDVNIRQKTTSLDGLVLWQASRQVSLAMISGFTDYGYVNAEFGETDIAERMGRKGNLLELVAYLQASPRVRLFLDGQYRTYAFKAETAADRDARSYGIFGGLEFVPQEGEILLAARLQGRFRLGYVCFDMKNPQLADGSGLAGEVDLSAELFRKTTANIIFSRGFQFSIYSGEQYYIFMTYGGGITRLLSRRTSLSYNLSFGRSHYPEDGVDGGPAPGRYHRSTTHGVRLRIALARNLSLGLVGTFGRRVSDETGRARSRNFIGFDLVYGYPPASMTASVGAAGQ